MLGRRQAERRVYRRGCSGQSDSNGMQESGGYFDKHTFLQEGVIEDRVMAYWTILCDHCTNRRPTHPPMFPSWDEWLATTGIG